MAHRTTVLALTLLVVAACSPAPEPSGPPESAPGDTILYACGSLPFTIEALVGGGSPLRAELEPVLAAFLGSDLPEVRFSLPTTGWRVAASSPSEVLLVADRQSSGGWAHATARLSGGSWAIATWGDCGPYAVVPAGLNPARWWIDPDQPPLRDDRGVAALVREQACAGGRPPVGRIEPPLVRYDPTAITIVLATRPAGGAADCQAAPDAPFRIELAEPIDGRALLDGYGLPARDARVEPEAGFGIGG